MERQSCTIIFKKTRVPRAPAKINRGEGITPHDPKDVVTWKNIHSAVVPSQTHTGSELKDLLPSALNINLKCKYKIVTITKRVYDISERLALHSVEDRRKISIFQLNLNILFIKTVIYLVS